MIGQYTKDEMIVKVKKAHPTNVSSLERYFQGRIILRTGSTKNYYKREKDGSWTNYNCRTTE